MAVLAICLVLLGGILDGWARPRPDRLPFPHTAVFIEVLSSGAGSRILFFPEPPTIMQVLDAAGIKTPLKQSGIDRRVIIPDRSQVWLTAGPNDPLEIRLGIMSTLNSFSLGRKMNLNRAGWRDLTFLPGVGPALAGRILDDRRRNGTLPRIGDLTRIRGIGPEKIRSLEPYITVDGEV